MKAYRFKPTLNMTIATLLVMALFIRLGFWQYNKAQAKIMAQQQIDQGLKLVPVDLPVNTKNQEQWRYKRIRFTGVYMPNYQILLDNRVYNTKAGYHIITPVKIIGEDSYVLVNRGWVEGSLKREVPLITTPDGEHTFVGDLFFPLDKVFSLESRHEESTAWQPLWQHMDMARYQKMVPFKVKPYIVRMAPESTAGGFVRDWPAPKNRITVHLGYAYQWFGFAFTLFVIYIALNVKKLEKGNKDNE